MARWSRCCYCTVELVAPPTAVETDIGSTSTADDDVVAVCDEERHKRGRWRVATQFAVVLRYISSVYMG